jgi:hypothetical protein
MPGVSQPAAAPAALRQPCAGGPDPDLPLRPRLVWPVLFTTLMAFQAYVVFVQEHGVTNTGGHATRALGEIAGQVAVRQTFTMAAGGLDGVTVRSQSSGQENDGTVIFELSEAGADPSGAADAPIYRTVVETRRVADDPTFTWRFAPLDDSSGKTYALRIAMPAAPFEHGLTLLATRDEHFEGGRLWYDGREQWGDLVVRTTAARATAFQRFEHALRDKPRWLRSRVTLALAFLLYTLALGIVLWAVLTAPDEGAPANDREGAAPAAQAVESSGESAARAGAPAAATPVGPTVTPAPTATTAGPAAGSAAPAAAGTTPAAGSIVSARAPTPASPRARLAGLVALLSICGFAAYVMYEPRVRIERGARELVAQFPETAKRTTMPSLQEGFRYESVTWKGRRMHCIVALPFSRINWTVDAPPSGELRGWFGMRPDAWQGQGDGSTFRVGVSDSGKYAEKVNRYLHPDTDVADRVFVPIRVDLAEHAGRRIEVILNTEPNFNAVGDAAMWCEVRVVARQ